MLKSTNAMNDQQNFTLKVEKKEDGTFRVTTPNVPGKVVESKFRDVAITQMNAQLQDAVKKGDITA